MSTSTISGNPLIGGRSVQLGMAVKRKPAITAGQKAEDHFMHMPFSRDIEKIGVVGPGKNHGPDRECHAGKDGGTQKKRSKSV